MFEVTPADVQITRALMAIRTMSTGLRSGTSIRDGSLPPTELSRRDQRWVTLGGEPGRSLIVGRVAMFWQLTPELSVLRHAETP